MLYDVPGRTASLIELDDLRGDARATTTSSSVKEASGLLPRTAQLVEMGYSVYSGDDVATLGYLAYGGVGLVSVVAHAAGDQLDVDDRRLGRAATTPRRCASTPRCSRPSTP